MHESLARLESMLTEYGAIDLLSQIRLRAMVHDANGGKRLFPHGEGRPDAKSAGMWDTTCILC